MLTFFSLLFALAVLDYDTHPSFHPTLSICATFMSSVSEKEKNKEGVRPE